MLTTCSICNLRTPLVDCQAKVCTAGGEDHPEHDGAGARVVAACRCNAWEGRRPGDRHHPTAWQRHAPQGVRQGVREGVRQGVREGSRCSEQNKGGCPCKAMRKTHTTHTKTKNDDVNVCAGIHLDAKDQRG